MVEREGGTLYCTALIFGPEGSLLGKHRKLMPTALERVIWGTGDGDIAAFEGVGGDVVGQVDDLAEGDFVSLAYSLAVCRAGFFLCHNWVSIEKLFSVT